MNGTGWHLDRRISVGHLVTTLVAALGAVVWIQRLEANLMLEAQATAVQSLRIDRLEQRTEGQLREIRAALARIEQKLDRKADKAAR